MPWIFWFQDMNMRKLIKSGMLALLTLNTLFLMGCSAMEGLGKDIQKGGQAIERAAQKHS
jgi:predicted small secreted protein